MSQPTVAAVMLVNGREAMARKAVECVRQQTYGNLELIVLDTGAEPFYLEWAFAAYRREKPLQTVGELRNRANDLTGADIIVHFDSDDLSNPHRIEEQVALLQASGADAVGYNEALFWDERMPSERYEWTGGAPLAERVPDAVVPIRHFANQGGAWLYSNPDPRFCLGASLCYWRKTWERKPFEATSQGEDFRFCVGLKTVGVSSLNNLKPIQRDGAIDLTPRFIARIHGGNTSTAYSEETMRQASEWRRVPEFDSHTRGVMAL